MSLSSNQNNNKEDEPIIADNIMTETTRASLNPNTNVIENESFTDTTQQQQGQQQQQQQSSSSTSSKIKKTKAYQKFQSIVQCVQTKVKYRTTMDGMIRNANRLLDEIIVVDSERVLSSSTTTTPPKKKGFQPPTIPSQLFEQCRGIVFLSVVEVGMMLTGNIGTGIVLRKQQKEPPSNTTTDSISALHRYGWSLPSACGLSGIGWGIQGGASLKDIIVFIMDDYTMEAMVADKGIKIGGQIELTIGTIVGQTAKLDYTTSATGMGSTIAIAYTKGLFAGISIEGAVLITRNDCNNDFYHHSSSSSSNGVTPTAREILYGSTTEYPTDRPTKLQDIYDKLNKLSNRTVGTVGTDTTTTTTTDDEKEYVIEAETKPSITDDEKEYVIESETNPSSSFSKTSTSAPPTAISTTTNNVHHNNTDHDSDSESDIVIVEQER